MNIKRKVLVFQPFSGIWNHSIQELSLILGLPKSEYEIATVTCGASFREHCTVRESRKRTIDSYASRSGFDCIDCKFAGKLMGISIGAKFEGLNVNLNSFVTEEIRSAATEVITATRKKTVAQAMELIVGDLNVGKMAMYETLLKFKKQTLNFTESECEYFFIQLHNVLITQYAARGLLEAIKPNDVIIYSPQYAVNNAFASVAELFGARVTFVEGSSNISERDSHVRIWNWTKYGLLNPATNNWPGKEALQLPKARDLARINSHFRQIQKGASHSVYSPVTKETIDVRLKLGVSPDKKIIVLALSSYDEVFAAIVINAFPKEKFVSAVFEDQYEWVVETINWARTNPDIVLVIRLHPRDLPNRRENQRSEQIDKWEEILTGLPGNVVIDHPKDQIPISSYWQTADLWITGWSSTAIEALRQGIEVVTYDSHLPSFPGDIHRTGNTRAEYFANLNEALRSPTDREILVNDVSKWLAFNFNRGTVEVGNTIFSFLKLRLPKSLSRLVNGFELFLFFITRPTDVISMFLKGTKFPSLKTYLAKSSDDLYQS